MFDFWVMEMAAVLDTKGPEMRSRDTAEKLRSPKR